MSKKKMMRVSLVISTYNWPDALRLCLESVTRQKRVPDEVIIADDGSTETTGQVADSFRGRLDIQHVWHEDKGFRKTVIMNKAFALCTGDYIIQTDGDIILDRHFIADHLAVARRGYYYDGSRGKLNRTVTEKALRTDSFVPHFWTAGLTRRLNTLRLPLLTPFFYGYRKHKPERGCNLAFWRDDLYAVNGYDERMIGYGSEDRDLPERLRRLGVRKRFVKFMAVEYHLYHEEHPTKRDHSANHAILLENREKGIIRVEYGIVKNG